METQPQRVVQIDPRVALSEAQAEIDWLRRRMLLQAQAITDLRAELRATAKDGEAVK